MLTFATDVQFDTGLIFRWLVYALAAVSANEIVLCSTLRLPAIIFLILTLLLMLQLLYTPIINLQRLLMQNIALHSYLDKVVQALP